MSAPSAAAYAEVDLAIGGMTCAACASRVEKVLNRLPEVDAAVNFATERAHIGFNPLTTDVPALIAAVQKAGYDATPPAPSDRQEIEHEQQLRRDIRLLLVAAVLSLPLVVQMGPMALERHEWMLPNWVQLALATPVQFWVGARFYRGAWHALRAGGANMDVLIALGTTAAWAYSTAVTLGGAAGHVYFEASAVIVTLVLFGKMLENRARGRASAAIKELVKLQPPLAHIERAGAVVEVPVAAIAIGEIFVVRPGEILPVDGEVIEGASSIDESMLTGESIAADKTPGSPLFAGTLNIQGWLRCRATSIGSQTALAGIIRLVEQAQGSKAPIQRLADKIAGIFVPAVLLFATVTFIGWLTVGVEFAEALVNAVAVLVIACPCALGLATPTAIMVGTGRGARVGILVKNAAALELAGRLDTLAVDKTGTLTEGKPEVTDIVTFNSATEREVLGIAASIEQGSEHPLARAIQREAARRAIDVVPIEQFSAAAGLGVRATIAGQDVILGAPQFLATHGIVLDGASVDALAARGRTVVAVGTAEHAIGLIGLADQLRSSSQAAVTSLRESGIAVVMLTGDNEVTAREIAASVGITHVVAKVLPADKAREIERYRQAGHIVGMVGDGVNDAPALAAADVSFAIGAGAGAAIHAADVTLMRSDLTSVVDAIHLSRATLTKVKQNLFFAFVYNVLGIPLAALGLLNPVVAGAAMALSSVSVVTNSLLLRRWRPNKSRGQGSGARD